MQRSSQAKLISTAGNFAILSGLLDVVPLSCLPIFLVVIAEFSASAFTGVGLYMADRTWSRENLNVLDISGNGHRFLTSYVTGLRTAIASTFLLSSILSSIGSTSGSVAAGLLLTLASATSFLVDIREATGKDSDKLAN